MDPAPKHRRDYRPLTPPAGFQENDLLVGRMADKQTDRQTDGQIGWKKTVEVKAADEGPIE
jgi:hypothetical protein